MWDGKNLENLLQRGKPHFSSLSLSYFKELFLICLSQITQNSSCICHRQNSSFSMSFSNHIELLYLCFLDRTLFLLSLHTLRSFYLSLSNTQHSSCSFSLSQNSISVFLSNRLNCFSLSLTTISVSLIPNNFNCPHPYLKFL